MSLLRGRGPRTRRLAAYLERRQRASPARRAAADAAFLRAVERLRAVVYTDTADFTLRTARDGILHFMMVFERAAARVGPRVARYGGRLVKVEADSLLMCFPDVEGACHGVEGVEGLLRELNRGHPANERLHLSYGVGYGAVLELEADLFGLEVNLASKLGEDLARPGEALLTPAATAALPPALRRRAVPHRIVTFGRTPLDIRRLRLRRA